MDKNTIIGFTLIALIFVGFSILNRPSEEEVARQTKYNDSITLVRQAALLEQQQQALIQAQQQLSANADTVSMTAAAIDEYGDFGVSAAGEEQFYTLENELLKLTFSNKGGRVYAAELKKFRTHDSLPLVLFRGEESNTAFTLVTSNNRAVNSSELFFKPVEGVTTDAEGKQVLRLRLATATDAYMDFVYRLAPNDYMLGFDIEANNMNEIMPSNTNSLEMAWNMKIRQQEKGRQFEARYAQMMYKFAAGDVEKMSESKADAVRVSNRLKWVAFKDQFFSSALIAGSGFSSTNLRSEIERETSPYLKSYSSDMIVAFDPQGNNPTSFHFYFGPNQYKILNDYDRGLASDEKLYLRELVSLGWGIFGWINRFLIIPIFNVLSLFISNFGVIILLMTIIIKLIIFPMTYKSYMSSAKMRVLKPEIDEINARIPADKAAERQKATMDLYSKVGVSPMSGCIPMLLQMPVLIAMFSFFPASIELRQESFLWAKDLSSYDAIFSWNAYIPLVSKYFGNHISLFCLLMTATTLIYNKLNTAMQPAATDQPGMGMMKWMMYLMPVMFMFIFNNYASGLTYYYFLSTLFSIAQTYIFRAVVDEKKLLAQLHAKRGAKTGKKKSGFMERLEKMQREQEKAMKNNSKRR
jgi:YidC/Oxa1 family membrane protein insertase